MSCIIPLCDLRPSQTGVIVKLLMPDPMRSRLQNLGFSPNRPITCRYVSPFHNPRAYEIYGTIIALRIEDSIGILVDIKPIQQEA